MSFWQASIQNINNVSQEISDAKIIAQAMERLGNEVGRGFSVVADQVKYSISLINNDIPYIIERADKARSDSGDLSQFSSMLRSFAKRFHLDIDPNQSSTQKPKPAVIDNNIEEVELFDSDAGTDDPGDNVELF